MNLPRRFESGILRPAEGRAARPLRTVELASGDLWLSDNLTLRGHRAVGLALHPAASRVFPVLRAGFEALPLTAAQFDLVIFNGTLHFATDYWHTLHECRRLLHWDGRIAILNTPIHKHWREGEDERAKLTGPPSLEMGYLDQGMIARLGGDLNIHWRIHKPWWSSAPQSNWILEGWWEGS